MAAASGRDDTDFAVFYGITRNEHTAVAVEKMHSVTVGKLDAFHHFVYKVFRFVNNLFHTYPHIDIDLIIYIADNRLYHDYPPKYALITCGSESNSFPVPSMITSPVART